MARTKQPDQPLVWDRGVIRFKGNAIIRYLSDAGKINLTDLAAIPFHDDDRRQLAQLMGYSVSGYGDLNYVSLHEARRHDERADRKIKERRRSKKK